MSYNNSELTERIRRHYEKLPYPLEPIEKSPDEDILCLYSNNIINSFYLKNKKIISPKNKFILDAGCGSGYTTLALAQANPEAKIFGVDLSKESVNIAKKRLQTYGFEHQNIYVLSIEELPSLGQKFDYINCDEVLYLLPEPVLGLQAMKSVLNPNGIIRTNLHSSFQRSNFYRAQELFKSMGLMAENSQELDIEIVWETMRNLKSQVLLKKQTWSEQFDQNKNLTLVNHLLQGDKGYTIPEMFSMLEAAELEFISMINWRQWELMDLFNEPDNLPVFLGLSLPEMSLKDRLHCYELLNPVHRLMDFWCGHPQQVQPFIQSADWTYSEWKKVKVHLHPQMKTAKVKEALVHCLTKIQPFEISNHLPIAGKPVEVDSKIAACLLFPLLESAPSIQFLVERWSQLQPLHPITLNPITHEEAFEIVRQVLLELEEVGYLLFEY